MSIRINGVMRELFHNISKINKNKKTSTLIKSMVLAMMCFMFVISTTHGQTEKKDYSVFLISNLDDLPPSSNRVELLIDHLDGMTSPFALIVNGDYFKEESLTLVKRLTRWISGNQSCRLVFVQGDRDWSDSGPEGWDRVRQVEYTIESLDYPNVVWINGKGCPGPNIISLDNHLQLIGINTQWFNHPYVKPEAESGSCKYAEKDEFFEELEDLMDEHSEQNVLVVGHFPIRSNGPYGGRYPLKEWLFPVPIISGFLTSYKQNVGSPKEINNERYQDFAEDLSDIFLARGSLVYASGHDKHTEILRHGSNYLINTGAFGQTTSVKQSRFTVVKEKEVSFTELIYGQNGDVSSVIWKLVADDRFVASQQHMLFQAPCDEPDPSILVNDRLIPCGLELPVLDEMVQKHPEKLTTIANENYMANANRTFFLGEHYRANWTTSVDVPVLNLDTKYDGLIPYSKGGGRQTTSLKFKADNGQEYVFRSVDKDPRPSLEYNLRNTVVGILLRDQTTTQHPYGALAIPAWLEDLELLHAKPELYVMPDDAKLGPWRKEFGGMLGMLELRPSDDVQYMFGEADDIKRTVKMMRELYKDRDNKIDVDEFLKARILDIAVGDWGRHEDNWKWAGYEKKKGMKFRPIPRDRDHVFSKWDGFLPWLADRSWAKASGENFAQEIKGMRSLTWQNRHMDRFLLSEADSASWAEAALVVQQAMTAESIAEGIGHLPTQDDNGNNSQVENILKARSGKLPEFAQQYYKLLAKQVDVVGSNKHEQFEVNRLEDGSVQVDMYKLKNRSKREKYYSRLFHPNETNEIRLFGLSGSDKFLIHGEAKKSILVRVVPGNGHDSIRDDSRVRMGKKATRLYVRDQDDDVVEGDKELKYHKHAPFSAYDYDRKSFKYDTYFPLLYLFYNSDRGFVSGGQVIFNKYKYGKEKQSSRHKINVSASTNGNFALRYRPRWSEVFGEWSIYGKLEYQSNRNFNFYFGKGLFAEYDNTLLDENYYTLQFSTFESGIGIGRSFWRNASASLLFTGFYNTNQLNLNSIASDQENIRGLESRFNTMFELMVDLDLRDRNDLPRTGYRFYLESKIGTDIKSEQGSFLSSAAHIEMFNTFHPITLGLRFGGAVNEGDVPYFLNQYLGRNTYLRGYRQNRFLGDQHVFLNSELRWELVDTDKAIVPLQFGLKFFADIGKVFLDGDNANSSDLFVGYGGGVYLVPYKEQLTLNLVAGFSKEERLLIQFRLGKPF